VQKVLDFGADTLVLGCTHYPFLIPIINKNFGDQLHLIDTSSAIIQQLGRKAQIEPKKGATEVKLFSTGDSNLILKQTNQLIQALNPTIQINASSIII
jgi:glutamate racemase